MDTDRGCTRAEPAATIASMKLLREQEQILFTLVESARKVPRHEQQFLLNSYETDQQIASIDVVQGAGLDGELRVLGEDVFILYREGFLEGQWNTDGGARFTVSAAGFAYYETLRDRSVDPAAAVEEEIRRSLESARFRDRFGEAYDRLAAAEQMLWRSRPEDDLTTIGHKLREAIQQFASAMIDLYQPLEFDADPARTKNRLRAVLEMHRARLGESKTELLTALIEYQDAVNSVVQRQEHGDQKPGDALTWEDGRAAVFQTAILMFEFDRLLNT